MKTILFLVISLISALSFGQISETDIAKAELLIGNYQNNIDSSRELTNGATLFYFSDTLFKGMILKLKNGDNIELDLRYRNNFQGYTELGTDFNKYILLKKRGNGSGIPIQLRSINKLTGEDQSLGEYPFYLDLENEIAVYKSSSFQILVHNFSTDKIESYPAPDTNCPCCDCYEILQFSSESFTIKFMDLQDQLTELEMKRIK